MERVREGLVGLAIAEGECCETLIVSSLASILLDIHIRYSEPTMVLH